MSATGPDKSTDLLRDKRVLLLGKLASMSHREAAKILRSHGAVVLDRADPTADLAVIGDESTTPLGSETLDSLLGPECRLAAEQGRLHIVPESQLWQQLGLVNNEPEIHRLYTPAMLAELLGVEVAVIRRWHRRGLIVPAREVRRLPYFDFQEVATARRLAELLSAGVSPRTIEKQLDSLARLLPGVARPLAQLSVIVRDKRILLRQGDGLVEPGGQFRFDFDEQPTEAEDEATPKQKPAQRGSLFESRQAIALPSAPEQLCELAAELEEDGQLDMAAEMYRAAMAGGGPTADLCFQVAELLYRVGDPAAARERYYMAIELDEDFVEARANLGCVLAEMRQFDLAVAAFEGALKYHPDYADVHYHLARTLDESERPARAEEHWRAFLDLAPDNPWADEARQRLASAPERLFP